MRKPLRKKYTRHYLKLRPAHEELIIEHARKQWEESERALKKHELIQKAKHAGLEVGSWILKLALAAGVLTIALAMPNVFYAVGKMSDGKRQYASLGQSAFDRQVVRGSKKMYWHYTKSSSGQYVITLTKLGRQVALRAEMRNFKFNTQPAWDGKWRLVMFDIRKKYSATRDTLRRKLLEIGMYPVQESIFAYPYPCTEEVMMWVELFGLGDQVEVATADFSPALNEKFKLIFKLKT